MSYELKEKLVFEKTSQTHQSVGRTCRWGLHPHTHIHKGVGGQTWWRWLQGGVGCL